jgi:hypothetical protein
LVEPVLWLTRLVWLPVAPFASRTFIFGTPAACSLLPCTSRFKFSVLKYEHVTNRTFYTIISIFTPLRPLLFFLTGGPKFEFAGSIGERLMGIFVWFSVTVTAKHK